MHPSLINIANIRSTASELLAPRQAIAPIGMGPVNPIGNVNSSAD